MDAIDSVREAYKAFGGESATFVRSLEDLEQFIASSDSSYIIIVTHNEKGLVYFPNGSISEISRLCDSHGKRAIFLSCNSEQILRASPTGGVGADSKLTYKDALDTPIDLQDAFEKLSQQGGISCPDLAGAIAAVRGEKKKLVVKAVVANGMVIALVVGTLPFGAEASPVHLHLALRVQRKSSHILIENRD